MPAEIWPKVLAGLAALLTAVLLALAYLAWAGGSVAQATDPGRFVAETQRLRIESRAAITGDTQALEALGASQAELARLKRELAGSAQPGSPLADLAAGADIEAIETSVATILASRGQFESAASARDRLRALAPELLGATGNLASALSPQGLAANQRYLNRFELTVQQIRQSVDLLATGGATVELVQVLRESEQYLGDIFAGLSGEASTLDMVAVSNAASADALQSAADVFGNVRGNIGTILGDGRIIVILDVGTLIRNQKDVGAVVQPVAQPQPAKPLTALVVDDSITMRRVTQRLLERHNIRVLTARDGMDAVTVLQDHAPDVILLDIEMPRMDGYQFATHVRNDPSAKDIPIIMITSRSGEKHRARAIEIGVNDYLSKPYQEDQLIRAITGLLGREL